MIYTIGMRREFGYGTMSTYYGLFKHEKRYANGFLSSETLVKRFATKDAAPKYCVRYGIKTESRYIEDLGGEE